MDADVKNPALWGIAAETATDPLVSVVLPIRNEERYIERSLDAVLKQSYPQDRLEVLVVDGMSTDATRSIVARYQEEYPHVHLLDNPEKIVSFALNRALAAARGQVVIRVDGHCEIDRHYVRRCVDHLDRDGVVGVGGPIETIAETVVGRAIAVAMSSRFGVGGSRFRTSGGKSLFVDTVPFPAYTREAVDRAGPFDEELVRDQDDEYNYRLRKLGGKLLLADDVRSRYYSRGSLGALGRQYFQYGYWKVRVMQKHPRQMSVRQFAPVCLIVSLAVSLSIVPFHQIGWWMLAALAGSYLAANLAASCLAVSKGAWPGGLLLPPIFAILHFSYGLGFLVGLIAFWNRWADKSRLPENV